MAKQIIHKLVDDIDGGDADETVKFALDGIQYEIDLGGTGSLTPRIDASYQSDSYSNPANSAYELIPAYTLANARMTWRNEGGDLDIALEVTNLFDDYYILTAYDSSNAGFATVQPGKPREWAVSVKKRF